MSVAVVLNCLVTGSRGQRAAAAGPELTSLSSTIFFETRVTSASDIGPLAVSKSDGASFGTDIANQYSRGISRLVKLKS